MHVKAKKNEIKKTQTRRRGKKTSQGYKAFHPNSFFIEAPQLQNGVGFTKTAERYSFTIASVQRQY